MGRSGTHRLRGAPVGAFHTGCVPRAEEHGVTWTLVPHAHTKHSFDSLAAPRDLVKVALAGGVHVLAVTDHDTWQGSVDVRVAATGTALRVILGVERFTDHGDLIGLFLTSDVVEKSAVRFCD